MITKCKFDKVRDFQETVPGLAMSIKMALQTGVVKDTATSTPYNKMTSTEEIGNYLCDAIDIAMASNRLNNALNSVQTGPATNNEETTK